MAKAEFAIVTPIIDLNPYEATAVGYNEIQVDVLGTDTVFLIGKTFARLLDVDGIEVHHISQVEVNSENALRLHLPGGIAPGDYLIEVATGYEVATAPFTVLAGTTDPGTTDPGTDPLPGIELNYNRVTAGYDKPLTFEVFGQNLILDGVDQPVLTIETELEATPVSHDALLTVTGPDTATITLALGLATGDYRFVITVGEQVADAEFAVVMPIIDLTPYEATAVGYNEIQVDVLGTDTYFRHGETMARLLDVDGIEVHHISQVEVNSENALRLHLPWGIAPGDYLIEVATGYEVVKAPFRVLIGVEVQPWAVRAGDPESHVVIRGSGTDFQPGTVSLRLLDDLGAEVADGIREFNVLGPDEISVRLGGPLPVGEYSLEITTGTDVLLAELESHIHPSISPDRVLSGYTGRDLQIFGGTMVPLAVGDQPTLTLYQEGDWIDRSEYLDTVTVTAPGEAMVFLKPGLPTGEYRMEIENDGHVGHAWFTAGIALLPELIEGYAIPVDMQLHTTGIPFGPGVQVQVKDFGGQVLATGGNVVAGDDGLITFQLNEQLGPNEYEIEVTDGYYTITSEFAVAAKTRNLQALIKDHLGQPIANAHVDVFRKADVGDWDKVIGGETDADGMLAMRLAAGDYVIRSLGFYGEEPRDTYIAFTIVDAEDPAMNPTVLVEPAPNLRVLVTVGGNPQADAGVNIVSIDDAGNPVWGQQWWRVTNAEGYIEGTMPMGNYSLWSVEVDDTHQDVDARFSVNAEGELLDADGNIIQQLTVKLQSFNVAGEVVYDDSGEGVPWAQIQFHPVDAADHSLFRFPHTSEAGTFKVALPAGTTYYVARVWAGEGEEYQFQSTEYVVSVDADGLAVPSSLVIRLPKINVVGTAVDEQGNPIMEGHVRIELQDAGTEPEGTEPEPEGTGTEPEGPKPYKDWHARVRDGQWKISLADGEYRVAGIIASDQYMEAEVNFTVSGGVASPSPVEARPIVPNVVGVARDREGNPVVNGWISFKPAADDEHDWSNARGTGTDAEGNFKIKLPELPDGGEWVVAGMGDSSGKWYQLKITFSLPQSNLVIEPERANLFGQVLDKSGEPVIRGHLAIGPRGATERQVNWESVRWVPTDEEGYFYVKLPAGEYTIFHVWTGMQPYAADVDVTIVDGAEPVQETVRPLTPNVTGQVLTETGAPLSQASVGLRPAEAGDEQWQEQIWVWTDEEGRFELKLPAGDYVVRFVSTPDSWEEYQIPFTAGSEPVHVTVQPPVANVEGEVLDRNGQPVTFTTVGLKPAGDDWSNVKWVRTGMAGTFRATLDVGQYEVIGFSMPNRWVAMHEAFEVTEGAVTQLAVAEARPNVTGTLRDGLNRIISRGHVGFQPADAAGDWSKTIWGQTTEEGLFEVKLPDGQWIVTAINNDEEKLYYDVRRAMITVTVQSGEVVNMGDLQPPANNVKGTVYTHRNKTQAAANAWIGIKPAGAAADDWSQVMWVWTDENGRFETHLRPGEYTVVSVHGAVHYDTQISFTAPAADLAITPPAARVTGNLRIDGGTVKASLAIRPVVGGMVSTDVGHTRWVPVREDGSWSAVLSTGEYAVVAVDDGLNRHATDVRFTVQNGSASVEVDVNTQ
ncbi:MAG TPA: carboxypeptidase-like regulatory domain-containing protein [Symbiobacteriaceae bacterium]|nr:carboxypeptidase-like regulatory domain-containing protein [Symbiobacteriaceae bacterium]